MDTRTRYASRSLLVQAACAGGLVLALLLLTVRPGLAERTPVASVALTDYGGEGRVHFGQIFVGTVLGIAGTDAVPTSDPADSIPVILYDVDVSRTLKGEAAGRIRIWYHGFDATPFDYPAVGKLQVGKRYLFFAGFNPEENHYPVGDGVGVIPIADDQDEAELVATFQPLIANHAREAKEVPAAAPCEQISRPVLQVTPHEVQPGDLIEVSATNLSRPRASIWLDKAGDTRLIVADVQADFSLTVEAAFPQADPGEHQIVLLDACGRSACTAITVLE